MDLKNKIEQCKDVIRDCDRDMGVLSDLSATVKAKTGRIEGIKGAADDFVAALAKRRNRIAKRRKAAASELAEYGRQLKLAEAKRRYKASKAEYRKLRWG